MRYRIVAFSVVLAIQICIATDADDRLPIPDQAAQKEADQLVQAVFGDQIKAASKAEDKLALVKELLEESSRADTSVTGRYAILKAAVDCAPDAHAAMTVIENMAQSFQIDEWKAKAYTIKQMSKSANTPSQCRALTTSAIGVAEEFVKKDSFGAAIALAEIAIDVAGRSRNDSLFRSIQSKKNEFTSLQQQYAIVEPALATLESDPTDTKSNLIVGRYKCLQKGEWQDGLPMLALGDDAALKNLALKELAEPDTTDGKVALADGWYGLAQNADDETKGRMLQRAAQWYKRLQGQSSLPRLVKAKVEKRITEIETTLAQHNLPEEINLLNLVDLSRHIVAGKWRLPEDGKLEFSYQTADKVVGKLEIPISEPLPDEYNLKASFTPTFFEPSGHILFGFPVNKGCFEFLVQHEEPKNLTRMTFCPKDLLRANDPRLGAAPLGITIPQQLPSGRAVELTLRIRHEEVVVYLNKKKAIVLESEHFNQIRKEPQASPTFKLRGWGNQVLFHSFDVEAK